MTFPSLSQFNPLKPIQDSNNNGIDLCMFQQQNQSPQFFADFMPKQPFSSSSSTRKTIIGNENFSFNKLPNSHYPPQDIYHLMNQSSSRKNKLNNLGELANHDWEAVMYFLRCQVRCGGDVSRVYKCNFCNHEFPNAQAFGGHMSSHSKTKKIPSKKTKRARKEASNFAYGNEKSLNMEREMVKDSMKEIRESEEYVNSEILEEVDEEWFKYLNFDIE